jgi:hypothetical protein
VKARKRKSKHNGPIKKKKRRGSREAVYIPSKARSKASIQSKASATHSVETYETDAEKEKEREQKSQEPTLKPLCSRKLTRYNELKRMGPTKRKQMRGSREAFIPSKACSETASRKKATQRKSNEKRTIKRKKRRELYDGDSIDPIMLHAGVWRW